MAKKNNFTQALRELTGFDGDNNIAEHEDSVDVADELEETVSFVDIEEDVVIPNVEKEDHVEFKVDKSAERSIITPNMVVTGNIQSKDVVEMSGEVRGDIMTSSDMRISGLVIGEVTGENIVVDDSSIRGNIKASGIMDIHKGSVIVGDIVAENIKLDGKVKGQLSIGDSAILTENALISGNIITSKISTSLGSRIKGSVTTKSDSDVDIDDEAEFVIGE